MSLLNIQLFKSLKITQICENFLPLLVDTLSDCQNFGSGITQFSWTVYLPITIYDLKKKKENKAPLFEALMAAIFELQILQMDQRDALRKTLYYPELFLRYAQIYDSQ